ncbi:hypothetical protein BH11MYX4_BH11MYX4_33200 [soil metagenome]
MMLGVGACCRPGGAERPYTPAELEAEERVQVARAGAGYTSAVVSPFVVIGNGPASAVRDDAAQTVAWARDLLKRDYFARDPGAILSIWVFRDEGSYRSGVSALFGPLSADTPYGYYSPCERALVMNVGYGYGTLVHEMVHAYMGANFPDAPVWLDEGLASLYEQPSCRAEPGADADPRVVAAPTTSGRLAGDLSLSRERGVERTPEEIAELACARHGHMRGGLNWRLPGLQDALRRGIAPSFERIGDAGRLSFDGKDAAPLYATSRYLLYWLQEKEVLVRYFHAFRARRGADSSGMRILSELLGRPLPELRREWEGYVSRLTLAR